MVVGVSFMEPILLKKLPPFNIQILDAEEYIKLKGCLPVTNMAMFESSTRRFHPDGLYSEVIFGQVGSKERLIRRGYIDLKTKIITPHLYKQVISLKSFYKEVIAGKAYAKIAANGDLELTTQDDPEGHTGYQWFLDILPTLKFPETESKTRRDKIALLNKYKNVLITTKLIVLPAGVRDVKASASGKISKEDINKYYTSLLSLTSALPDTPTTNPIFDTIKYQIQMKVQEIYNYIGNLVDGKGGFAQHRFAARGIVYGSRNVITAAPMTRVTSSKSDPHAFNPHEAFVPLFQAMKSAMPLMVNQLKSIFFEQIFAQGSENVPLIDPQRANSLTYAKVSYKEMMRFTTSEGINDLMTNYRNPEIHFEPVTCKATNNEGQLQDYYLYLVYDNDDEVYFFRDVNIFREYYSHKLNLGTHALKTLQLLDDIKDNVAIIGSTALYMLGYQVEPEELTVMPIRPIGAQIEGVRIGDDAWWKEFDPKANTPEAYKSMCINVDGYWVLAPERLLQQYIASKRLKDKDKIKFLKSIYLDTRRIRPLTWTEMFYMAAFRGLYNKHGVFTRYPILLLENIVPDKLHIVSTTNARKVRIRSLQSNEDVDVICPEYPIIGEKVKDSMSVHPAHLDKYDGDHDGFSI